MVGMSAHVGVRKGIRLFSGPRGVVDILYVALQAHGIVNVALHCVYSPGIVFIFSLGKKYLYLV
jgi:hypothetical protein